MLRFYVICALVACALGASLKPVPQLARDWDRSGRIVGGEKADIRDAPYQVAMMFTLAISTTLACGGSIIREDVIVCAAHCTIGTLPWMWKVRGGSTQKLLGGQSTRVKEIIAHEDYNGKTIDFDISLYVLKNAFVFDGETIAPIPLPAQGQQVEDGALGLVTGWGTTFSGGVTVNTLRKVTIPIVSQHDCWSAYAGINEITVNMICAGRLGVGGQDACQGDSGGPLAVDGVLIGITSWGVGCARPEYPGVWTRVPEFVDWISDNLPELTAN